MLPRAVLLALCLTLMPVWSSASPADFRQGSGGIVHSSGGFQRSYLPPIFMGTHTFIQQQTFRPQPQPEQPTAVVDFVPGADPKLQGRLFLFKRGHGVYITGYIKGLAPGFHGFHVHEVAALGNMCKDAGPHFNPFMKKHGSQTSIDRHVGDLGNIQANLYGDAYIDLYDDLITLDQGSEAYIGDRAFVVHEKEDDLGLGGDQESITTGNAGARLGCGLVRVLPISSPRGYSHPEPVYPYNPTQAGTVFG